MIPEERKERLLALLKKEKFLSAKQIAEKLFISEATARRDISDLASLNLAHKVYGGISYVEQNQLDIPATIRSTIRVQEKILLAQKARELIKDGMNLFIHTGTTCFRLIEALDESITLNVLTDDLRIAHRLSKFPNIQVELTPGFVREGFDCVYGSETSSYIGKRYADLFFFSCSAFSFAHSARTRNEKDIDIVKSFMKNSRKTILLLDEAKINHTDFYQICDLNEIDCIISNYSPTPEELKICQENQIQFISC